MGQILLVLVSDKTILCALPKCIYNKGCVLKFQPSIFEANLKGSNYFG
jgi:hypothetical protein